MPASGGERREPPAGGAGGLSGVRGRVWGCEGDGRKRPGLRGSVGLGGSRRVSFRAPSLVRVGSCQIPKQSVCQNRTRGPLGTRKTHLGSQLRSFRRERRGRRSTDDCKEGPTDCSSHKNDKSHRNDAPHYGAYSSASSETSSAKGDVPHRRTSSQTFSRHSAKGAPRPHSRALFRRGLPNCAEPASPASMTPSE